MSFEDPLEWDRQVQNGHYLTEQYRRALRVDPVKADASGPLVGVPFITTRAGFAKIRELPDGLPFREPLLGWALRLADARVNAELERQLALYWRSDEVALDLPRPLRTTRAALLLRVLSDMPARRTWLEVLGEHLGGMRESISLLWQRRDELAKRAGFQGFSAATDPVPGLQEHISQWLTHVRAVNDQLWPRDVVGFLNVALASDASQGWPAHLNAQSVAALLGSKAWLARSVREPDWPRLIGPTSFMRSLYAVGRALGFAWAAGTHPYAIAHAPGGQNEHRLGFLLAALPTSPEWQKRVLGVREDRARAQVRGLTKALICAVHMLCLQVRLVRSAEQSAGALARSYEQHSIELFGFELPPAFAGMLPRLEYYAAHQLVACWRALSDHVRLRNVYDVDWFRNPRALEAILEESAAIESAPLDAAALEQHQLAAAAWLREGMHA
jgi:hypothetical protein